MKYGAVQKLRRFKYPPPKFAGSCPFDVHLLNDGRKEDTSDGQVQLQDLLFADTSPVIAPNASHQAFKVIPFAH